MIPTTTGNGVGSRKAATDSAMPSDLVDHARRALPRIDELVGANCAAAALELTGMVRGLSERLREFGTFMGLEYREAWRLLNLRDALDSHELAASLLSSSDAPVEVVLKVLSRGLHATCAALTSESD